MLLLSGAEAAKRVGNFINQEHQIHGYSVELTAKQIYHLDPNGEVDFGGSEYVASTRNPVATHQKHSQDRYQWWTLTHGAYQIEFNETLELASDQIGFLEPHERLLRTGAEHAPIFLRGKCDPLTMLLTVSGGRVQIKQNARISKLRVFRLGEGASTLAAPAKPARKKR